jgi:hypothetical protein
LVRVKGVTRLCYLCCLAKIFLEESFFSDPVRTRSHIQHDSNPKEMFNDKSHSQTSLILICVHFKRPDPAFSMSLQRSVPPKLPKHQHAHHICHLSTAQWLWSLGPCAEEPKPAQAPGVTTGTAVPQNSLDCVS